MVQISKEEKEPMEFSTCHPSGTEEANASIIFTFTESVFAESVNQLTLAIDSFVAQSTDKELCAESALAGQHHYKGTSEGSRSSDQSESRGVRGGQSNLTKFVC